jgi:hypothetical protein
MEMCKDGEWVKADEAEKIIDFKGEQLIFLDEDNSRLKEENEHLQKKLVAHKNGYETLNECYDNLAAQEYMKHRLSVALGVLSSVLLIDLVIRITH